MKNIAENLKSVKQRINAAEQKYGRKLGSVKLLAVSKTHPISPIRQALVSGQTDFGENYLQEAIDKINALKQEKITWHFIGSIQSNKTKILAEYFDWIQSLDREKVARRINEARSPELPPINVCIQVNISDEKTKSGISPFEIKNFSDYLLQLPGLRLRGLMIIPAIHSGFKEQRRSFRKANDLFQQLVLGGLDLDTLSMGMTDDLEAAIAEGSTMIRIGTAIFGPRQA